MSRVLPEKVRPLWSNAEVDAFLAAPEVSPDMALLLAQTFGALADPTRVRMLYALTKGEHSVGDLAAIAASRPRQPRTSSRACATCGL